jgi:NADH-quinone oxidoreductase subunit L
MTHAFFKGLLFLGCGAVIYALVHEQNIWKMGGLKRYLPITYWTFLIAAAANAGVVPLAGFWSKDEIIAGAWSTDINVFWGKVVAIVLLGSAFLTALYMFRLVFVVFHGQPRFDAAHQHPKDPPLVMTIPLILLAIPSALIGFIGVPPDDGRIQHFLEPVFSEEAAAPSGGTETASLYALQDQPAAEEPAANEHEVSNTVKITFGILSTIGAFLGIFLAYLAYVKGTISAAELSRRYAGLYGFLKDKWRWDELYDRVIVQPAKSTAMFCWRVIDVEIIDGTVNGLANGIGAFSQRLRHVQTGLVANYALAIALGMVVMVGVYLAAFSNLFR